MGGAHSAPLPLPQPTEAPGEAAAPALAARIFLARRSQWVCVCAFAIKAGGMLPACVCKLLQSLLTVQPGLRACRSADSTDRRSAQRRRQRSSGAAERRSPSAGATVLASPAGLQSAVCLILPEAPRCSVEGARRPGCAADEQRPAELPPPVGCSAWRRRRSRRLGRPLAAAQRPPGADGRRPAPPRRELLAPAGLGPLRLLQLLQPCSSQLWS